MKRNVIIILAFNFLLVLSAFGQTDFQKGYVITQDNDTIRGEINNNNFYDNSQFCDFKKEKSDSVIRYYPDKIFGYRFTDGKFYIAKEINSKKIFLEYLIDGVLDIYFCRDINGDNHYYAKNDTSTISELKYDAGIKELDGKQVFYKSKMFVGVLNYLTSDCEPISKDIRSLDTPEHKGLIKIARKYNDLTCNDKKCIVYEKKVPRKVKFNLVGGVDFSVSADRDFDNLQTIGFNVLFQQSTRNERFYTGIGVIKAFDRISSISLILLPLSVNYIHPKQGISPAFKYELYLSHLFMVQSLNAGVNYRVKKLSVFFNVGVKTFAFVLPKTFSTNIGVMFDLNKRKSTN